MPGTEQTPSDQSFGLWSARQKPADDVFYFYALDGGLETVLRKNRVDHHIASTTSCSANIASKLAMAGRAWCSGNRCSAASDYCSHHSADLPN